MAVQNGWRMCDFCFGIFFNGHALKGKCPSPAADQFTKGQHSADPTIRFQLTFIVPPTPKKPNAQDKWSWCHKCEGLFFHGNQTDGICPAGGRHSADLSGKYQIQFSPVGKIAIGNLPGEILWCFKCEGMYCRFDPHPAGVCPGVGEHSRHGSGNYFIPPS